MPTQVLAIKPAECLCIGDEITVKVLDVQGLQVRVEIEAPQKVAIRGDKFVERRTTTEHVPRPSGQR
jgi:carbon storage regulator CsrA